MDRVDPKRHIRVVLSGERSQRGELKKDFIERLRNLREKYPDLSQMLVDFCDIGYYGCDQCDIA
jgi:hypothetical protein